MCAAVDDKTTCGRAPSHCVDVRQDKGIELPEIIERESSWLLAANENRSLQSGGVALCIGLTADEVAALTDDLDNGNKNCHAVPYSMLDETLLDDLRPDQVITPLFGEGYDAVDVAENLSLFGFCGQLVAMSPRLPNPKIIEREMREYAYAMNFKLVMYDEELLLRA